VPGRERLRRHPDRKTAALLECPVVLRPVADLVARPGDLMAARLIGLVGHRASGKRGSGPIRSTLAQPKPKARNFAPTPPAPARVRRSGPEPSRRRARAPHGAGGPASSTARNGPEPGRGSPAGGTP